MLSLKPRWLAGHRGLCLSHRGRLGRLGRTDFQCRKSCTENLTRAFSARGRKASQTILRIGRRKPPFLATYAPGRLTQRDASQKDSFFLISCGCKLTTTPKLKSWKNDERRTGQSPPAFRSFWLCTLLCAAEFVEFLPDFWCRTFQKCPR